jgi:hypothetical protein
MADVTEMAQEIGELRGRVMALETQFAAERVATAEWRRDMTMKIDAMYGVVMSAKGGVRTLLTASTISAAVGGVLVAILQALRGH